MIEERDRRQLLQRVCIYKQKAMDTQYSPFRLYVTVHYASNLAIADILSSDPYVVLQVDDKLIGKTKTIYANHINPSWEHDFEHSLLHLKHSLKLKVFDEDQNKHDDFMGQVVIELSSISVNIAVPLDAKLMDIAGEAETKGTLRFTVKIEQSDNLVKVVDIPGRERLGNSDGCSEVVSVIQEELKAVGIDDSDPVQDAILESPIVANHTTLLSKYMVRDLLHDVFSLTVPTTADGVEVLFPGRVRTCLQAVSSTLLDFSSGKCTPAAPTGKFGLCLQCYATAWDVVPEKAIDIYFSNRFATWLWVIYFRLAVDYWREVISREELPLFIQDSNLIMQTSTAVSIEFEEKSLSGILVLNFNEKDRIICEHLETREVLGTISLQSLRDMTVAVDSSTPRKFSFVIKNISLRLTKKLSRQSSDMSLSGKVDVAIGEEEAKPKPAKMFPLLRKVGKFTKSLGSAVVGTASAATDVVATSVADGASAASGLAVDAAKFATSSAATAVRTIAAADAMGAISAVTNVKEVGVTVGSSVIGAGSSVVNAVSNIHHGTFLQNMVHLQIRAGEKIVTTQSIPYADDVEWSDVNIDFDVAEEDLAGEDTRGVEILCYKGQSGAELPFASRFVPFSYLWKKVDCGNKSRVPLKICNLLGLRVSLLNASGIKALAVFRQASYCIYASCKCLKWNGVGRGIKFPSLKSKAVPAGTDIKWEDEDFVLLQEHGIEWAQYIRIQLSHGHVLSGQKQGLGSTSLGVIYIPFDEFSNISKMRTFPLYAKDSNKLAGGEVTVSFRRIQDEVDDSPKAFVDCVLEEDDTVSWAAQAIISGGVEDKLTPSEGFSVCPSFQGLNISRFTSKDLLPSSNDAADGLGLENQISMDLSNASQPDASTSQLSVQPAVSVESKSIQQYEVFENERCSVKPPFKFGPGNLFVHPHFSDFTGKIKVDCERVEDINPPQGCDWVGPWSIDRKHTKTDEEGWSYAISYDFLVSNCLNNASHATSTARPSRRRKHVRSYQLKSTNVTIPSPTNNATNMHLSQKMRRSSLLDMNAVTGAVSGVTGAVAGAVTSAITIPFGKGPESWKSRLEVFSAHPELVVGLCKERASMEEDVVIIPWTQVVDAEEVTESTLFLRARVHRYFGANSSGEDVYHLADVDFFLYNCPSRLLKRLITERIAVYSIRRDVMQIIAAGDIDGGVQRDEADQNVLSTVDLSLGSHVVAQLDVELLSLAEEIKQLQQHNNPSELAALQFRECRLRLYVASMLRANIKGKHEFRDADIDAIIARDCEVMKQITHDNDVATANNRIEFLLDAAETHLRDAALCGWKYKSNHRLHRFIERIINAYLIEMVSLLGRFFDDNKVMKQVKGLSSKTQLIMTFMRHNDRLGQLLDSALRPYYLQPVPRPQLQLFLKLDTLVSWYSSALEQEMFSKVDNVILSWKDPSMAAGGDASRYKHALPWIPMRAGAHCGVFMSQIPEDVRETLFNYLLYARFNDSEAALSFRQVTEKFDERIGIIFVKAFMHLVDSYATTIDSVNWGVCSDELGAEIMQEVMEERLEFLCSVANDLRRIDTDTLLVKQGPLVEIFQKDSVIAATAAASARLVRLISRVGEHLSSVVLRILSSDPRWVNPAADVDWIGGAEAIDPNAEQTGFAGQMTDVGDLLDSKVNYLDPFCMYKLMYSTSFKVVGRYLHLLKHAEETGRIVAKNSKELKSIVIDTAVIKECFFGLTNNDTLGMFTDSILSHSKCLDQMMVLITFDRQSEEFEKTLQSVLKISQSHPMHAIAFARFVECCLSLRDDNQRAPQVAKRRTSMLSTMISSASSVVSSASSNAPSSTRSLDPISTVIVQEIRDCYEPTDQDEDKSFWHPVAVIFSDNSKFTLSNFLFGAKSQQPALHSSKSIVGSMLSFISSATPNNPSSGIGLDVDSVIHDYSSGDVPSTCRNRIRVSNIACGSLFCLSGKPKAYLSFSIDGITSKTAVREGTTPNWADELEFDVSDLSTRRTGLVCSLYYLGKIYGDECIASVGIPLASLELSPIDGDVFKFDVWKAPKVKAAADRAQLLGSELPYVSLSISVIS